MQLCSSDKERRWTKSRRTSEHGACPQRRSFWKGLYLNFFFILVHRFKVPSPRKSARCVLSLSLCLLFAPKPPHLTCGFFPSLSCRFAITKCLSLRGERPSQAELDVLLDGLQEGSPEWDKLMRVLPAQSSG